MKKTAALKSGGFCCFDYVSAESSVKLGVVMYARRKGGIHLTGNKAPLPVAAGGGRLVHAGIFSETEPILHGDNGGIGNGAESGADERIHKIIAVIVHIIPAIFKVAFGKGFDPARNGKVIVGSGVAYAVLFKIMWKAVICIIVFAESKFKDLHTGEAAIGKKLTDVVGEEAEIFRNDWVIFKLFFDNAEKIHTGTFSPFAVACGGIAVGHAVISGKSAEMVNAENVIFVPAGFEPCYPPFIAAFLVVIPVINRVAPKLAVNGKGIRRAACNTAGTALFVKIEKFRVCPDVAAVVRNVDGKVADDFYAALVGVIFKIMPLAVEFILEELPEADFPFVFVGESFEKVGFAVAVNVYPFAPALAVVGIFKGHEKSVFVKPALFFFAKSFESGDIALRHEIFVCLAKNGIAVFVNMGIIDVSRFGAPAKVFKILFFEIAVDVQKIKVDEIGVARKG